MYVCMAITHSKSKDQPGKVANPARGQLKRENNISLSPFEPDNFISQDEFGRPVPRQPAYYEGSNAEKGGFERSRRDLFLDVSVGVHILLVVEQSSLKLSLGGVVAVVVVVSHIQRIGCQPGKNYFTRWLIPLVVC